MLSTCKQQLALLALAATVTVAAPAHGDVKVYRKAVSGTVLFYFVDVRGASVGSGVLVDGAKGLVVTADHVIRNRVRDGNYDVTLFFPARAKNGRLVTSAPYYAKHPDVSVPGKVILQNRTKDLALIRIDPKKIPAGVKAIPLATEDPDPGENVHVIGNSNFFEGGAFGYSEGKVRCLYYYDSPGAVFYSLTHHAPSNQGDSGGAVLDDDGKLLGIISQGTTGKQNKQIVDNSVHFGEIKRALELLQQPGGRKTIVHACVDSIGFDEFYFPALKGAQVHVDLQGDGKTDLDLFADDMDNPKGEAITFGKMAKRFGKLWIREAGDSDHEQGQFVTDWSGTTRVLVQNVGGKGNAKNDYSLTIDATLQGFPLTAIRRLAAHKEDVYEFHYQGGKGDARIGFRGDGDTELSLVVEDPKGAQVGAAKTFETLADVRWTPTVNGTYKIRLRNLGKIWNKYVLTTD